MFLVLSEEARSPVTFACHVQIVNTTSEALDVALNPDCGTIVEEARPQVNISGMEHESACLQH